MPFAVSTVHLVGEEVPCRGTFEVSKEGFEGACLLASISQYLHISLKER